MLARLLKTDPRWLFLGFFSAVIFDTFYFDHHVKTFFQLAAAVAGALGSDVLLNRLKLGEWIFPRSGLVSSCGTFMLITGPYVWPFFLLGFLAMYSKHFVTFRGRHVFNPVAFGAILCLVYLQDYVQNGASSWSGNFIMLPFLTFFGALLTLQARTFLISISYLGAFFLIQHFYLSSILPANAAAFASPPFMLFVFFMISDPKTGPQNRLGQLCYGVTVAVIESYFLANAKLSGGVWALLIVNLAYQVARPLLLDILSLLKVVGRDGAVT